MAMVQEWCIVWTYVEWCIHSWITWIRMERLPTPTYTIYHNLQVVDCSSEVSHHFETPKQCIAPKASRFAEMRPWNRNQHPRWTGQAWKASERSEWLKFLVGLALHIFHGILTNLFLCTILDSHSHPLYSIKPPAVVHALALFLISCCEAYPLHGCSDFKFRCVGLEIKTSNVLGVQAAKGQTSERCC